MDFLQDVTIFKPSEGVLMQEKFKMFEIESIYNYEKSIVFLKILIRCPLLI